MQRAYESNNLLCRPATLNGNGYSLEATRNLKSLDGVIPRPEAYYRNFSQYKQIRIRRQRSFKAKENEI